MEHLEASEQLTRFLDGDLDRSQRLEVEQHLGTCDECREWVAAYRLLSESLGGDSQPLTTTKVGAHHLESDELCAYALAAHTLSEPVREKCLRHLDSCPECWYEIDLVRTAAATAEDAEPGRMRPQIVGNPSQGVSFSAVAWAAGLFLAVGALIVVGGIGTPGSRQLTDSTLTGHTVVKARDSILVQKTRVEPGAELTLRTGNTVAFGDGFSIDSGGTLSVVVDNSHDS